MLLYLRLLIATVPRGFVARRDLLIENLVLRQQLAVYARRPGIFPNCFPQRTAGDVVTKCKETTSHGPDRRPHRHVPRRLRGGGQIAQHHHR